MKLKKRKQRFINDIVKVVIIIGGANTDHQLYIAIFNSKFLKGLELSLERLEYCPYLNKNASSLGLKDISFCLNYLFSGSFFNWPERL